MALAPRTNRGFLQRARRHLSRACFADRAIRRARSTSAYVAAFAAHDGGPTADLARCAFLPFASRDAGSHPILLGRTRSILAIAAAIRAPVDASSHSACA